jgi:uncharacterized damage-inducible protein DinB
MADTLIQNLIRQLKDVENGDLWLDENFEKKLDGITETEAFIRPIPELHSVAELLSHLIVWRRVNIRRMLGETVDMPVEHPDNWKGNEVLQMMGWKVLLSDFYASQQEVLKMLEDKDDTYLVSISTHYGKDFLYLVQGLVHHDLYHMGQLGLTIKYLHPKK